MGDWFGQAVSLSGDSALVGAPFAKVGSGYAGAAYIFSREGESWSQQAKLIASDSQPMDYFGGAVAISGDTAIVGAPFAAGAGSASGAAYVFTRSGDVWTEQTKLTAADAAPYTVFGFSVSLRSGLAAIGAPGEGAAETDPGSVYLFQRSGGVWTQHSKLASADGAAKDCFGLSAALGKGILIAGAPYNSDPEFESGAAYVFDLLLDAGSGAEWRLYE